MKEYYFKNDEFVIENYDKQRTFTSFLPAIAGKKGIPLWSFYVNRGQIMSSFGIKDKNGAILEFFPAYTAYQVVNRIGFRTFIKKNGHLSEIFSATSSDKYKRMMRIKREQVTIEEINYTLKLKIEVTYFTIPNDNVAALARKVKLSNLDDKDNEFEIIDGLSQIFTPGTEHGVFKVLSNLQRSWMEVTGVDETKTAYYRLSSSTNDSAVVTKVTKGNFYLSMVDGNIVAPIVDPSLVFGYDNSYSYPFNFKKYDLDKLLKLEQYPYDKVLCGFTPAHIVVKKDKSTRIDTLIGQMHSYDAYKELIPVVASLGYIDRKQKENTKIIEDMVSVVRPDTNITLFDNYIESTFLDNLLRGGFPFDFKDNKGKDHIYYLFSRKHGDPERDYNWFNIENEFYSQGNGNFRDICQNRRNDSMLFANVKDFNLKLFMSLVQLDGYNPLSVNGTTFTIENKDIIDKLVNDNFVDKDDIMKNLLSSKFTPGSVVNTQINNNIEAKVSEEKYLANILDYSKNNFEAAFSEGYWCDHFTYILDLYESYIATYPDLESEVLFDDKGYMFFESPCFVNPRWAKSCELEDGKIRQYGALYEHDVVKIKTFNLNPNATNYAKFKDGNYITTNLASKMFMLGFLKFNLLDNHGIGIEMEGGKPGWNDACNGIPGLFGSSVGETFEVKRIIDTCDKIVTTYKDKSLYLPKEFYEFYKANMKLLKDGLDGFEYYNKASNLREDYREFLRTGLSNNVEVRLSEIKTGINLMKRKLDQAINKAKDLGDGIIPTFLTYEVTKYEYVKDENGNNKTGYNGYKLVLPLEYKLKMVPYFLEAPARALKVLHDKKYNKTMYEKIKHSGIYDEKLMMYKTSEPLDNESLELGRVRAFNKGWLERESNFMHMTYKYLLGLLKAKMYKEFYKEIKTNMVCNMNPKIYGRSTLEHCSFIATTNNPDKNIHGQGFVSRLSGSTTEMLSMYLYMMTGGKLFDMVDGKLHLAISPLASREYFKEDNTMSFKLLGDVKVTYVNNKKEDGYKLRPVHYVLENENERKELDAVLGLDAIDVRNKKYDRITIVLE